MIDRVEEKFAIKPRRLVGDTNYGVAAMLGWLVDEKGIVPHVPVWDKSEHHDGTFSRTDFVFDVENNQYVCPAGKQLRPPRRGQAINPSRYRASVYDCQVCELKPKCCPNMVARKIDRSPKNLLAISLAPSAKPRLIACPAGSEKRWRCCSPTSNASLNSANYACVAPAAPMMSFF